MDLSDLDFDIPAMVLLAKQLIDMVHDSDLGFIMNVIFGMLAISTASVTLYDLSARAGQGGARVNVVLNQTVRRMNRRN